MRMDRRQTPRMAVEGLAYINLDPNNGGVILNISEGGLCFHSTTPVQSTATVRFWFAQRNRRVAAAGGAALTAEAQASSSIGFIEVDSELAWTDETKKRGGLRFTNLPADARKEIRDWMNQHAMPAVIAGKPAPSARPLPESPSLRTNRWDTIAARRGSSATLQMPSPNTESPKPLTGFSGGLMAGVLISALVAGLFLLQTHRSDVGESLIRLGERLGGKSWTHPASPAPPPPPSSPQPEVAAQEAQVVTPVQIPVARAEKPRSQPTAPAVKSQGVKPEGMNPAGAIALPAANAQVSSMNSTRSTTPPLAPVPTIADAPTSSFLLVAEPRMESASQPSVGVERSKEAGTGSLSERFLEVGKFNEKLWADQTTDKLSQVGFSATVIQKNRLWKKSYQVLVGPYGSDSEAEAAHKDLVSRGFAPRSFERGSRGFAMPAALKVDSTRLPAGTCVISWESYIPDAIVKIEGDRGSSVTVEGKWVKRGLRYYENAVVYRKNADGSRTLLEIQFSGMGQVLVFGKG
jgi:hypothetical protein